MVNFVTIAVLSIQGLALRPLLFLMTLIGRIQNVGGNGSSAPGDGLGLQNFFKVQDIFNGSTVELINALIVIANNVYIVGTTGQLGAPGGTGPRYILVFVHHDIAELCW